MNYTGCEGIAKANGDTVVELTGFVIEQSTNILDASKMGTSCSREIKNGQLTWSGSIEAFYDPDDVGLNELRNGVLVALELYPEGVNDLSGNALITGVSTPIETDGMITQNINFEGVGELTISGAIPLTALLDETTSAALLDETTSQILIEE